MRIQFLGGVRTVTGSMHLLETEGGSVLLECGLFQGHREEANRRNRELPGPAKHCSAVVLSHAHIDHSGALPSLAKSGWKGDVHMTDATADLAALIANGNRAARAKRSSSSDDRKPTCCSTLGNFGEITSSTSGTDSGPRSSSGWMLVSPS